MKGLKDEEGSSASSKMPKKKSKKGRGGAQNRRPKRVAVTIVATDEIAADKETGGQPARKPNKKKKDVATVDSRSASIASLSTKSTKLTDIYGGRRSAPTTVTNRRRFTYKPASFVYQSKGSNVSSSVRPKEHLKATARMLLDDERNILKAAQAESSKPPSKPVVRGELRLLSRMHRVNSHKHNTQVCTDKIYFITFSQKGTERTCTHV